MSELRKPVRSTQKPRPYRFPHAHAPYPKTKLKGRNLEIRVSNIASVPIRVYQGDESERDACSAPPYQFESCTTDGLWLRIGGRSHESAPSFANRRSSLKQLRTVVTCAVLNVLTDIERSLSSSEMPPGEAQPAGGHEPIASVPRSL